MAATIYVALLRGINVGGNHKVPMPQLKLLFENLGHKKVATYINSGNIIFESELPTTSLESDLTNAFVEEFGFSAAILVRSIDQIKTTADGLDPLWENNSDQKTDVIFLPNDIKSPSVLKTISVDPVIDTLIYVDGAIIWHIDRSNYSRSGMNNFIKNPLYKKVTVRNCNTVRKVHEIMQSID